MLLAGIMAMPAQAATLIGQSPPPGTIAGCGSGLTTLQVNVAAGNDYRVPAGPGVITQWRHFGGAGSHQVSFVVFGPDVTGDFATTRAFTDLLTPVAGANTFPDRIPVSGGERIGIYTAAGASSCAYNTTLPGDLSLINAVGGPVLGASVHYNQQPQRRVNLAAVVEADADGDKYGDESQDSCPVDAGSVLPCQASVDKGPKKKTTSRKAKFTFSVPAGSGISFECAIDKKAFAACSSPATFKKLKPKKHTFKVQAKNGAGQVGPVGIYRWRIKG
jgi:hypothetical protein